MDLDARRDDGPRVRAGIGTLNERSLHADIIAWLAQPGDAFEVPVDGYVIDIVRGDTLIEVQTGGFASIRTKLRRLLADHRVVLVYPIPETKWIVHVDVETGERQSRRRSPKRGRLTDLFDELVRMPTLINHPRLTIDALVTHQDEIRVDDGQGSWRRKGVSIVDQRLIDVLRTVEIASRDDLLDLLPEELTMPYTAKDLAAAAHIPLRRAQRMCYCLRKTGAAEQVGKAGRAYVYGPPGAEAPD